MEDYTCIAIHGQADDWQEAIQLAGDALCAAGVADANFTERCLRREEQYPTGLPTAVPVAIPHCENSGTDQSGICFLHLDHPVDFGRADLFSGQVETDMVFALALAEDGQHVRVLKALFSLFRQPAELQRVSAMTDAEAASYLHGLLVSGT